MYCQIYENLNDILVFDIDEMFEFFMNFWNIVKKISFHVFLVFYAIFSSIFRTKNSVVENKKWGGQFFFYKNKSFYFI